MKQTLKTFFIVGFAFLAAYTSQAAKIKNFILDSSRVYTIKVAADHRGTTTLMFPSALGALNGTNIKNKPNIPGAFFITYNDAAILDRFQNITSIRKFLINF